MIHLATHGYLHPKRAMTSGLLLTVPSKQPDRGDTRNDGVLQAWEIVNRLKLRAELVVLSACETGRGEIVRNEGIVGLSRAFQSTGEKAVIASQWKVNAPSTSTLIVAFHRSVRQGFRKDQALREAMTQVQATLETAHPFHWVPFLLLGSRHGLLPSQAK